MDGEITFNIEKPLTEKELLDFRLYKKEIKALLKKGKLKVTERYLDFSFAISGYSTDEKNKVTEFLKKGTQRVKIIR